MAKKLTPKQEKFVDAFVATGVGAEAARAAYDIPEDNTHLAAVVASENLTKPDIKQAIASKITPEMVVKAHASLLEAVRLDYFVFSKSMKDEEIKAHVEAQGLQCTNIRESERGKLAFFTLPDGMARGKGIELYHRLHGSFAPDKSFHVHVKAEPNDRIKQLAKKLNG